jgi:hypothetical protein
MATTCFDWEAFEALCRKIEKQMDIQRVSGWIIMGKTA